MSFAHDTEVSLAATAALVNSGRDGVEELPDVPALNEFVARWQWTGSRTRDPQELAAVWRLRARLAALWEMTADEAVVLVNTLLRDASALPQLVRHDGWDYHVHATPPDAPLADRMAVDAAMAVADVIRSGEFARLRVCGLTCANRVNLAAYRSRRTAS
jgi:hypothetical protein